MTIFLTFLLLFAGVSASNNKVCNVYMPFDDDTEIIQETPPRHHLKTKGYTVVTSHHFARGSGSLFIENGLLEIAKINKNENSQLSAGTFGNTGSWCLFYRCRDSNKCDKRGVLLSANSQNFSSLILIETQAPELIVTKIGGRTSNNSSTSTRTRVDYRSHDEDAFTQVCLVYDGTETKHYVNKKLEVKSRISIGNDTFSSIQSYLIGALSSDTPRGSFNGFVDEILICEGKVLSPKEIRAHWRGHRALFKAGLVASAPKIPEPKGLSKEEIENAWLNFKKMYNLKYESDRDEKTALKIYESNLQFVHRHNIRYAVGKEKFKMSANFSWTAMSREHFAKTKLGYTRDVQESYRKAAIDKDPSLVYRYNAERSIWNEFDWRKENGKCVTQVRDQGYCGGCYAFSAAGAMEIGGCIKKAGNNETAIGISPQVYIDCAGHDYSSYGCRVGGVPSKLFMYARDKNRTDELNSYPYTGTDDQCKPPQSDPVVKVTGLKYVEHNSENALLQALSESGPVAIAVCSADRTFKGYGGGLYDNPTCCEQVDHAVLLIGYNRESLIIKNSWGTDWGDNGYMYMARGATVKKCGVLTSDASFPLIQP